MTILLVIAILVVLIIGHEFGHFIVAKWRGVRVEEFGLGYPPRALTLGRWGETEYTINWLPFGGFVRLYGEDRLRVPESQRARSLVGASHTSQALILVAGVVMNVLLAWGFFTAGFMAGLPASVPAGTPGAHLMVNAVVPGSPAEEAGLMVGDEITSIIARDGHGAPELSPEAVVAFIQDRGGKEIVLTYVREGIATTTAMTPAHAVLESAEGRPAVGVALSLVAQQRYSLGRALLAGAQETGYSLINVSKGLAVFLRDTVLGGADFSSIVGPVGLVGVVGSAAGYGVGQILGIAAFISVNLAVINMIPIPALDGGRLLIVGLEALTRRKVSVALIQLVNLAGFAGIILLMLVVTYHDIARIAG